MASIRRRTICLPDDVSVTILRLPDHLTTAVLRAMVAAEIYILCGKTTGPSGLDTGFGAYVGISAALEQTMARSGVSLRNWAVQNRRLHPEVVVLVNRSTRMNANAQLLIEATLARAISPDHSLLNIRTSAPAAAIAAGRHQRLWAQHTSDRLAGLVLGQVFHPHPALALGGTTREQLVRLVLAQNRPMNIREIMQAAQEAAIIIGGKTPVQSTRRDLTTRERDGATGRPRLLRTHIGGLAVIYPAAMTLRQARVDYAATHPQAASGSSQPAPQTTPSLHTKSAA